MTRQEELTVEGMTCASCVAHVTRALKKVPGVLDARVNLATERATVDVESTVSPQQLIGAIERAGYGAAVPADASPLQDEDAIRRDAEIARKRRLLIFALVLAIPTVVLGMAVGNFPGKDWLMLVLTLPVWGVVGWEFHRGALAAARHGTTNMDTLVSLGSTAALLYSIYASFVMQPTYYETASAIITLIFLGKYLEAVAKGKSNGAIRALLALRPQTARVRRTDGSTAEIPVDDVRVGDMVIVPAGERIPVDGVVLEGASAIDVSMLTGEPIPREVEAGDTISAGTLNGDGTIVARASAVGAGTTLAHIVEIVRRAQGSTPPIQRLADRVASVFVPVILIIAAVTFAGWMIHGATWVQALVVAVAVLVVACPCALGLATPAAIIVAAGAAARIGVLFKDADALERLGSVKTIVFDKTGTLTVGHPQVVGVRAAGARREILSLAAAIERGSSHPLASAIVRAAESESVRILNATDVRTERGAGAGGRIAGEDVLVGSAAFLESRGVRELDRVSMPLESATTVFVARGGAAVGAIELRDSARPHAAQAIAALKKLGVESWLVSGDAKAPVEALAAELGIERALAQTSPESKAAIVAQAREHDDRIAFVGDGINDAPALATATVGIAMGGGTQIAMETAQAAVISNDPLAIARAVELSRATMRTIRQNLFWAFAYNVVLIPLAALGIVRPIFAAAAMGMSSLFVVGNSLRLRSKR